MFKKQFSVPEKQTSITQEQILHDIEAIRKASREENDNEPFAKSEKREQWYADLKEFNSISHNLVGALDDGGDIRDQLHSTEKNLQKISEKIKTHVRDILEQQK